MGVNVGSKLVGDRSVQSRLKEVKVTETQFADNAALHTTSKAAFESAAAEYEEVTSDFRLKMSVEKTKEMAVGQEVDVTPVQVKGTVWIL